jgi:seryl-tRNA synthetase
MLDIKFIRENKELVADGAKKKHIDFDVEKLLSVDDKRRELISLIEKKRAEQNEVGEKIVKTSDPAQKSQMIVEMQSLKVELQKEEEELKGIMHDWQMLMVAVPNIPDMSVPEGTDDKDNKEVKTWGEIPKFDFTPKDHIELMQNLGQKLPDLEVIF